MSIKRMRFMTRREWLKKHYPHCVSEKYHGGVKGHPDQYGFSDAQAAYEHCTGFDPIKCRKCFDRPAVINGKYILVRRED